jgi:uncharacterized protein (DUF736 family)
MLNVTAEVLIVPGAIRSGSAPSKKLATQTPRVIAGWKVTVQDEVDVMPVILRSLLVLPVATVPEPHEETVGGPPFDGAPTA